MQVINAMVMSVADAEAIRTVLYRIRRCNRQLVTVSAGTCSTSKRKRCELWYYSCLE